MNSRNTCWPLHTQILCCLPLKLLCFRSAYNIGRSNTLLNIIATTCTILGSGFAVWIAPGQTQIRPLLRATSKTQTKHKQKPWIHNSTHGHILWKLRQVAYYAHAFLSIMLSRLLLHICHSCHEEKIPLPWELPPKLPLWSVHSQARGRKHTHTHTHTPETYSK
jgi:hypothetical protein